MARIRVPMATGIGGIQAIAPTFQEVPGSYQGDPAVCDKNGIKAGVALNNPLLGGVTVLVDVPDEDVTGAALDAAKIKQRYPTHYLVVNHTIAGT